jgi:3-methylcrotonyl-CoA carboxylase alpha subunit
MRSRLTQQAAIELLAESMFDGGPVYGELRLSLQQEPPWVALPGFRMNSVSSDRIWFGLGDEAIEVVELPADWESRNVWGERLSAGLVVFDFGEARLVRTRSDPSNSASDTSGTILSPMPGRIIAVDVTQGQTVIKGQKLLTLEAMKMEHSLTAPFDGVVAELNAKAGAQVQVEALLVRIEAVSE